MTNEELDILRFPIGVFDRTQSIGPSEINKWIDDIESFPKRLKAQIMNLKTSELLWRYRPDGWSIAQVVHHCSDSHLNSLVRFKLALTEEHPTIRPYEEHLWAELEDSKSLDLSNSLQVLEGIHAKWVLLLKGLSKDDLKRTFQHPSESESTTIEQNIGIYAWHCNHHLGHVMGAIKGAGVYV